MEPLRPYKKELNYSYTPGAYAPIELLRSKPEAVRAVYIHSEFNDKAGMEELCGRHGIPVRYGDRHFARLNQKENSYVTAVFEKYTCRLKPDKPHVVLINPSDAGNLGTIIRTMAGLNLRDLAVITPAADVFNPKTIRASMGALFCVRFMEFGGFDEYRRAYGGHTVFPFMLDGVCSLGAADCPKPALFALVFGNEATGLPAAYASAGVSIRIPYSRSVDSFNLAVAAGIGMHAFAAGCGLV